MSIPHYSMSSRSRRPVLLLLLFAVFLGGCPGPAVRPPPERPPTERPVTPPPEKPSVRPPIQGEYPANIALLLPLSGRQEAAGIAVRDGFLAAWFQQEPARRPAVRIYDVGGENGSNALLTAISEGAQFVVGPLVKDDVAAVAAIADGRLPVLALNFLPDGSVAPQNFYQFALSPEDEARQAAQRVITDGRARGVALVPIGDWGTRVLNAFAQELTQLGGVLAARSAYSEDESDHSPVIQQLFRISESRERHNRLVSLLGTKLEFEPRRRGDVQFIFVAAHPSQGRQLRPQLKFHYVGDVPMYTTSDVFEADETANIDLDGVIFPHMPWVLATSPRATTARATVERAWPSRASRRGNLYAFGYDAWQLIPELVGRDARRSTNEMIDGVTGRLLIDADGRIRRDLDWARIRDGKPRLLPPSSALPPKG
jgi:uncharacterized protein